MIRALGRHLGNEFLLLIVLLPAAAIFFSPCSKWTAIVAIVYSGFCGRLYGSCRWAEGFSEGLKIGKQTPGNGKKQETDFAKDS
ncbi:hypothetical protein GCM10009425_39830 [Pseudomonas asuensis]|uniref:Uncharacterized protein n=1 Tax=Pseudomonas asuensis TaxID=1825787 RepID=A0ABQ2H2J6_9PSED|nr:hypothetical protein GCM10009425_39830 [Pseudomonas asuensis]